MLSSWMYVSRVNVHGPDLGQQIDSIEAVSLYRNAQLEVTGALIFAARSFAQYIEGLPSSIDFLRSTIERDGRHDQVQTILQDSISGRRFSRWQLAYRGMSSYVEKRIRAPDVQLTMNGNDSAGRLLELLREFASQGSR